MPASNSIQFDPQSLTLSVLGPSKTASFTLLPLHESCGDYSFWIDPAYDDLVQINLGEVIASAPFGYPLDKYQVNAYYTRDDNTADEIFVPIEINVVACEVQQLVFFEQIDPSTLLEPEIDNQPLTLTFSTTQSPNCQYDVNFSLSPILSFLSVTNISFSDGAVLIMNAARSHHSSNEVILTASVDGLTITETFQILIRDACSRSVF
jgi:hypothetical protein